MKLFSIIALAAMPFIWWNQPSLTPEEIIKKVDDNNFSESRKVKSTMVIYGKRGKREITSISYSRGYYDTYSEYLSPAREKGTKMLKLENHLWIYSPSSDRTIQISGHMLRQSVMGSDLSYEDMMEQRSFLETYDVKIESEVQIEGRNCWVLLLTAKVDDVAYYKRKIWVDQEYFIPVKEDLFAKSGQLLKRTILSDIQKIDNRWVPLKINFKDMLKEGKGTDYIINEIEFNPKIPEHYFTKAILRK